MTTSERRPARGAGRVVVAVTGSTRCGTTLVMEMLHHGGVPAYADNLVSFESGKVLGLPRDHAWLAECGGHAVKLLEPLAFRPPAGWPYRFVLMQRDPIEQARSQIKFNRLVGGIDVGDGVLGPLAESLRRDYPRMRRFLENLGPVLPLAFEDVLANPPRAARQIQAFLGRVLDTDAMAACVVQRPAACLPGLLEMDLYHERQEAEQTAAVPQAGEGDR